MRNSRFEISPCRQYSLLSQHFFSSLRIIGDMAKSRIAIFSNLSDNFLFIFSVRLVGLVNLVSRKYKANRYWPTNLDFPFKFWAFHEFRISRNLEHNLYIYTFIKNLIVSIADWCEGISTTHSERTPPQVRANSKGWISRFSNFTYIHHELFDMIRNSECETWRGNLNWLVSSDFLYTCGKQSLRTLRGVHWI